MGGLLDGGGLGMVVGRRMEDGRLLDGGGWACRGRRMAVLDGGGLGM